VYAVLDTLEEQIREQDGMIERVAKKYPDVEVVSQVTGVGVLTALVYVLTIDDKNRFKNSRSSPLRYPEVSDRGEVPVRPERRNPASITTMRMIIARALSQMLPCCPSCGRVTQ
jgi:transposase